MFNLPAISGDWSIEKMSNIKKNQALLWYSNGQSELSLLDSLALGFYSDAEFLLMIRLYDSKKIVNNDYIKISEQQ